MARRTLLAIATALSIAACTGAAPSVVSPAGSTAPTVSPSVAAPPPSLAASPTGTPAVPALSGTIAFMREDGPDHWQLWIACADLSDARQLTPDAPQQSGWPAFSPDGTRIAFNSNRDDPDLTDNDDVWDIYTMDTDGGDVKKLTGSVGNSVDPAYSRDGRLIAFGWDAPGKEGIYVMNAADGSGVRRITTLPEDASSEIGPSFSPDGSQLVFTRIVSDSASALFVVGLDGSPPVRITPPDIVAAEPDWSHDGTRIAVHAASAGFWVMGTDGSGLKNLTVLTKTPGARDGLSDPVWAPDDSLIMLDHGLHFADGTVTVGLATIRPDGTDLRYVTDGLGGDEKPDWSDASC